MDGIGGSDSSLDDLMVDYSKLGSRVIWIWCIEYIAKFKRDVDCIRDVFRMAPKLPDDLGDNTKEVVSLRILEYLFDSNKGQTEDGPSVSKPKVDIKLSSSCHDVLQEILEEISLSDLKPGAAALSKWNILPFIAHKRDHLPKCALERLRDEIVKEKLPKEAFTLEMCDLVCGNEQQRPINNNDDDDNDNGMHTPTLGSPKGSKRIEEDLNKVHQAQVNSKKDGCDLEIESFNKGHDGNEGMVVDNENIDKEMSVETIETREIAVLENQQSRRLNENMAIENCHDRFRLTEEVQSLNDTDRFSDAELVDRAPEKENQSEGHYVNGSPDGLSDLNNPIKEKGASGDLMDQSERKNVLTEENPHSSCQMKQSSCLKCKRDGDLLVCASSTCSSAIHEKCLKFRPQFDEKGNFLCPQCYYTRVTSEYYEVMEQLPVARRRCVGFLRKLSLKTKEMMVRWGDQDSSANPG